MSGIIKSVPGVKGGYALARSADKITFWDVVEAVEGSEPFFQCAEIRQNNILIDKNNLPETHTKCPCLIKVVMLEAENEMKKYLNNKTLGWLYNQVYNNILPKEMEKATIEWFKNIKNNSIKNNKTSVMWQFKLAFLLMFYYLFLYNLNYNY